MMEIVRVNAAGQALRFAIALSLFAPVGDLAAEFRWQTATPESQGMSQGRLEGMKEKLAARGSKALLVAGQGVEQDHAAGDGAGWRETLR